MKLALSIIQTNFQYRNPLVMTNKPIYIILHHAEAVTSSAEDIHQWHLDFGWSGAGYHYLVRKDGTIYALRPELAASANCYNHDFDSIAICAEGNYQTEMTMPKAQENSIIALAQDIRSRYPIKEIYRHRELYAQTDCPGQYYPFDRIKSSITGRATISTTGGAIISTPSSSSSPSYSGNQNGATSGDTSKFKAKDYDEKKSAKFEAKGYPKYNFDSSTTQKIMELSCRMHNARRSSPPGYYEYVNMPHRKDADKFSLRIGDCQFIIPPEFIEIKTTSDTKTMVGIRQSSSIKTKSGFSKRAIKVSLFFNGWEQINGFKSTNNPMGYTYYFDGLRCLLAQFKCTPFLPIENEFLNVTNDIWNVALSGINVSTVQGFPDCLVAELTLLEFNAVPLIEAPNFMYNSFIDWDLFRFYYQQWLIDNPPARITNRTFPLYPVPNYPNMTEIFKLKIISEDFLAGLVQDKKSQSENWILNSDANFVDVITSEMRVSMTEVYIGYQNMLSEIQLSKHETPTYQYMGGMDTSFTMVFETYDRDVVNRFVRLHKQTMRYVRDYRNLVGLGFVAITNELTGLFGTKFLMINSIDVSTIPDYPDHFKITVDALSYDPTQFDAEQLTSFKPFGGHTNNEGITGKFEDAISNTREGLVTKIKQDNFAEIKMSKMDLYPDLYLPTVEEVNEAITKIVKFRQDNNLRQIRYSDYPLDPIDNGYSAKYIDPDFYVFYPIQWNNLSDEAKKIVDMSTSANGSTVFGGVGGGPAVQGKNNQAFLKWLVPQAQRTWRELGILPSVTIAQAIEESGWGGSWAAQNKNSLFGVQYPGKKAPGLNIGKYRANGYDWRSYDSWDDSVTDHAVFLTQSNYTGIVGNKDFNSCISILDKAGYCEGGYQGRITTIYKENNLAQYDNGGAFTGTASSAASGGVNAPGVTTANIDESKFGVPIKALSLLEWGSANPFIDTTNYVERACTDMRAYNARGRMLRAFPTYCMLIMDEGGDWLDGRKLWTNYYRQHNLVDISIHQTKQNPVHTATIKVTNVYQNLSRYPSVMSFDKSKQSASWWYQTFGIMWGTPALTQEMIDNKNILVKHINLDTGARIHVRLGYGSNASAFNVSFNGTVTEIDTGDIINITAQSDGLELVNNVISTTPDQTNTIKNFGNEPSNIIYNILENRQSWLGPFLAMFNKTKDKSRGTYFEANQFGIEHFGQYMFNNSGIQEAGDGIAGGDMFDRWLSSQSNPMVAAAYFLGGTVNALKENKLFETISSLWGKYTHKVEKTEMIEDWTKNVLMYARQYDLVKNIYLANYKGETMAGKVDLDGKIINPLLNPFDGEDNIRMFIYNKTPWDACQVVTQFTPEYICQPHYNQFHSTLFFGHPSWNVKYKYDVIAGKIYEYGKPFCQYHIYDTLSDIIDNQIMASSKELFTNVVCSYSIEDNLETTPTLYADRNIYWSKQKTKVIDTTVYQNIPLGDTLAKLAGWKPGEEAAIQIGISNLMESFGGMYKGNLIVIGDPSIKPCDIMGVFDDYVDMHGTCGVREVVHHFSLETGFITDITPELVTSTAAEYSLFADWLPTFGSLTLGLASIKALKYAGIHSLVSIDRAITSKTGVRALNTTYNIFFKVKDALSTGNAVVKFKETATTLEGASKAFNAAKGAVSISSTLIKVEEGAAILGSMICPAIGTIVLWLAASVALNSIFDAIVEYFHYWNTIKIYPLVYKGRPFVMGIGGHKRLIWGVTDNQNDIDMTNRSNGVGNRFMTDRASAVIATGGSASGPVSNGVIYGTINSGFPLAERNTVITGKYLENRGNHLHDGVDFGCPSGTPLYSVVAGEVISTGIINGYGNSVLIWDGTHTFHYAHMTSIQVVYGDKVTKGQQVGLSGGDPKDRPPGIIPSSSLDPVGSSTGPHLHFGCYNTKGWSKDHSNPLKVLGFE